MYNRKHYLLDDQEFLDYLSQVGIDPDMVDWDDPYMVQELEDNFYSRGL